MEKLNRILGQILDLAIGCLMVGIVVILFIGVVLRYVFNSPLFWSEEITLMAMIWITFLAGGLLVRDDKNVAISFVVDFLRPSPARAVRYVSESLVMLILVVMARQSWLLIDKMAFGVTPALRISEAWFGWALFVGFILMIFYQAQRLVGLFRGRSNPTVGGGPGCGCKL